MEQKSLAIIYSGQEYQLEDICKQGLESEFWELYKQSNQGQIIDDIFKIKYKNDILSIKDIQKQQHLLISQLKLPDNIALLQNSHLPTAIAVFNDAIQKEDFPEFYETLRLFDVLYNRMISARYALMESIYILHPSTSISWECGAKAQYWLRAEFLNNAILWYHSSFDILLQTIWIGKKLYYTKTTKNLRDILTLDDYDRILAGCGWGKIESWLESQKENDEFLVCQFRKGSIYRKVQTWANKLKHRNGVYYMETYVEEILPHEIFNYNPIKFSPSLISIDNVIDTLVSYHKALLCVIEEIRKILKVNVFD